MRIYIAGPMAGIPQFNFPLFMEAKKFLTEIGGFVVFSPLSWMTQMELNEALYGAGSEKGDRYPIDYENCLSRSVQVLLSSEIEAILLLPNWQQSRGAQIEALIGLNLGKIFFDLAPPPNMRVQSVDRHRVRFSLQMQLKMQLD